MASAHPLPGISLLKGSRIVINHTHGTKTGKVLCCNEPTAHEAEWRMAVLFDDDTCSACSVSAVDVTATLEIQNKKKQIGDINMTRSRQDVMDDLRDLLGCEDIELSVLIAEALEHLEASQKAFELLGGETT